MKLNLSLSENGVRKMQTICEFWDSSKEANVDGDMEKTNKKVNTFAEKILKACEKTLRGEHTEGSLGRDEDDDGEEAPAVNNKKEKEDAIAAERDLVSKRCHLMSIFWQRLRRQKDLEFELREVGIYNFAEIARAGLAPADASMNKLYEKLQEGKNFGVDKARGPDEKVTTEFREGGTCLVKKGDSTPKEEEKPRPQHQTGTHYVSVKSFAEITSRYQFPGFTREMEDMCSRAYQVKGLDPNGHFELKDKAHASSYSFLPEWLTFDQGSTEEEIRKDFKGNPKLDSRPPAQQTKPEKHFVTVKPYAKINYRDEAPHWAADMLDMCERTFEVKRVDITGFFALYNGTRTFVFRADWLYFDQGSSEEDIVKDLKEDN